jgi:hypothetical protein
VYCGLQDSPINFKTKRSFYSCMLQQSLTALHGASFALGDIVQGRSPWVWKWRLDHRVALATGVQSIVSSEHLQLLMTLAAPPRSRGGQTLSRGGLFCLISLAHSTFSEHMVGEKGLLDLVAMHVQGWANAASAAANSTAQLARAQTKTKLAHQFHHQLAGMAIQIATGLALRACNRLAMRAGGMHTVLATAICRLHARIQVHAAAGLMLLASTRGVTVPSYGDGGQDDTQLEVPIASREELEALVEALAMANVAGVHFVTIALWSLVRNEENRKVVTELGAPWHLLMWISNLMMFETTHVAIPGVRPFVSMTHPSHPLFI